MGGAGGGGGGIIEFNGEEITKFNGEEIWHELYQKSLLKIINFDRI